MQMFDVFISYSHIDKKYADAICHHLEEANIKCWYAPRNIPVGAVWAESIIDAISQSRVFIIIVSKNSVISSQVYKEMNLAKENNHKIITFTISKVKVSEDIHSILESGHWLDSMNKLLYSSLDEIHQKVCEDLQIEYSKVKKKNKRIALLTRSIHNLRARFLNAAAKIKRLILDNIYDYLKDSGILMILIIILIITVGIFLYYTGEKIYIRLVCGIWA